MRILVTGGGGFLGQALCRGLVERGFDVTSFNRGQKRTSQVITQVLQMSLRMVAHSHWLYLTF